MRSIETRLTGAGCAAAKIEERKVQTEIDNIVRGFRANVMAEILHHRQHEGQGAVASFEANVTRHRQRAIIKLDDLRAQDGREHTAVVLDAAEAKITGLAAAEVARVRAAGTVEFQEVA
jgi:hypothetical protein